MKWAALILIFFVLICAFNYHNNTKKSWSEMILGEPVPMPLLPDSKLTPGSHFAVTKDIVCGKGYATKARHVSDSTKKKVYTAYNVVPNAGICASEPCELDHLIPLELGGDNSIQNLWPQPAATPGYHEKDRLEDFLHREVCANRIDLADAQQCISKNWWLCYLEYHLQ